MTSTTPMTIPGFEGELVHPGDPSYDQRRTVWNAMADRRPALIARCTTARDVAAAVRFGRSQRPRDRGAMRRPRILGFAVPEGGLMIDLTPMGGVRVDPTKRRRAFVGGGALLGTLDREAERFGLATTAGNISHTGVGGLTLGGGMGWLGRRFGLSCDNVETYTVVTAARRHRPRGPRPSNPTCTGGSAAGAGTSAW